MKKSCVYALINLKTKNKYIGSANNFEKRKSQHLRMLRNNNHHNIKLQRAYNKYGANSFKFEILEECSLESKLIREQHYLDKLKPEYNISINSSAPMEGRKHSKKTKQKWKGRKAWNKGIKRTSEEIKNISEGRRQMYKSMTPKEREITRNKNRKHFEKYKPSFKGYHHTEENKKRLREIRKSKKRIICLNTGEIFEAQIDIARKYNLKQGHISENLNGKRSSVKGFKFKYEE